MKSSRLQKVLNSFISLLWFAFIFVNALQAFAVPGKTTYQAKIIKPDGYPLEVSSVNFKFTILDPAGTCILYSETYSSVNMSGTGGLISFALGSGVKTYPASATTFEQVFSNITPNLSCDVGGPADYTPAASDIRKIVMQFHDGSGWQTLPAMSINAVPYAMYANEAAKLNGLQASDFVQVSTVPTCAASEALRYTGASFSCVAVGGGSVTSSTVITALGYTPADGASVTTLTSNFSSVSSTVFSVSSTVTSLQNSVAASFAAITSSQWTTSGTNIFYNAGNVGIGTTNPQSKLALYGSDPRLIIEGDSGSSQAALWFKYFGSQMASIMYHNTTGLLIQSNNNSPVILGGNYQQTVYIMPTGKVGIGIAAPVTGLEVSGGVRISMESATCTTSFAGTLRYNASNVEYCNGTSWQSFGVSGAGITNLNGSTSGTQSFATGTGGTAPNFNTSNGVHTLNIPLASAGSVTAGLLSNTDYTTFSNKITSSAASIAQVLGYVPADNSVSGTYAQKTNNLSDLTNVATARTNLGLGTFATASSIDLGSASATGTLSIARLPSFTGDATIAAASNTIILSNSGVTAGTYTKVTVDAKGRVTSGAQIASNDVTTALGYTPANSATITSSQWNTSGTTINYMTGNVGIGTSAPTSPLEVTETDASSGVILTNTNSTVSRYPLMGVVNYAGSTTGHPVLSMSNSLGTADVPAAINSGMNLGTLLWTGRVTASQTMQGARIDAIAEANFGVNTAPTRLTFSVAPSSGNYVQRMVINSTGNVGIGITTPTAKLHLAAGTSSTAALKFTSGTLLTSAESGTLEYDGFNFYVTDSTNTRRTIATGSSAGTIDNASNINSSGNITMTPNGGSVIVSATTASTNTNTGALVVNGGLGVAGNINAGGAVQGVSVTATSGMISPYIAGSVASGGSLTLDSTTHATKGNILLAPNGGNVGVGTTAPGYKLQVHAAGTSDLMLSTGSDDSRLYLTDTNRSLRGVPGGAIAVQTGATERMRIDSLGNVGIGTTNPNAKLDVAGQAWFGVTNKLKLQESGDALSLQGTLATDDNQKKSLLLNAWGGNVGIRTTSPTSVLDIRTSVSSSVKMSDGAIEVQRDEASSSNTGGYIDLKKNSSEDYRVRMYYNSSGGASSEGGLSIVTSLTGVSGSDKMFISANGNVGIGTSMPSTPLHVVSAGVSGWNSVIKLETTAANAHPLIMFRHAGADTGYVGFGDGGVTNGFGVYNYLNADLTLGTSSTTMMTFKPSGSIGIGTTSPQSKLHVYSNTNSVTPVIEGNDPYINSGLRFVDNGQSTAGKVKEWSIWHGRDGGTWASGLGFMRYDAVNPCSGGICDTSLFLHDNGNIGVGTMSPSERLHVAGNLRVQGSTDCTLGNGAGGTNCSSDVRLKENIKPIPYAVEKIVSLKGVEFDWNAKSISHGRHDIGVIAQDVEKVFPSAVIDDKNTGYKKVDYAVLVAPLIQAVKELYNSILGEKKHNTQQDRQIAQTENAVRKLAYENQELKAENAELKAKDELKTKQLNDIRVYLCAKDPNAPICK